MAIRRLVLASVLLLPAMSSCAPVATEARAESAAASLTRTVILTSPQLEIRVACAESATLADREFMGFELDNRSGAPLALSSITLGWDFVEQDATTGALLGSGSMQSYLVEPLRQVLGSRNGDGPMVLPPGITAVRGTSSDGVRFGLGLGRANLRAFRGPDEPAIGDAPMRVMLRPRAHAWFPGGAGIRSVDPPPVVAFTWSLPDEDGLARLGEEARALLALPVDAARPVREPLERLLEDDRVAAHVSRDALLDALRRRLSPEGDAEPEDALPIAECVGRRHSRDPEVRAFILDALSRRQPTVLVWLACVPALWSDDYLPFVRQMADAPRASDLLAAHASPPVPESPEIIVQPSPAAPARETPSSWQVALSGPPAGEPAITDDAVIVQGRDGTVHAVALDTGAPLWTARVTSAGWGVQGVTPAAKLVVVAVVRPEPFTGGFFAAAVAAHDDAPGVLTEFVALSARDGRVAWRSRDPEFCEKAGCVAGDVVVFETRPRLTFWTAGSGKHSLAALDVATGALRWRVPAGGWRESAAVTAGTSVAFIARRDGRARIEVHDLATGAPAAGAAMSARSRPEPVAITQAGNRFVIGEAFGPMGGTISAWSAGAAEPDWTIDVDHLPALSSAGAVVLSCGPKGDGSVVQALDPATGGVRWTADGDVLAASPESAIIVPQLASRGHGPMLVTWRDPSTGAVQAARSCDVNVPCAAGGRRLVWAAGGELTSILPSDAAPPRQRAEAGAGAERIAWRESVGEEARSLAMAAGVACVGHGPGAVTAFDVATGARLWGRPAGCEAPPVAWGRGEAFLVGDWFDAALVDARTGAERRRMRREARNAFDGDAGLYVSVARAEPAASRGAAIRAVEIATGAVAWSITDGELAAPAAAFLDEDQVMAMLADGSLRAWRIKDGAPRWSAHAGLAADDRLAGKPVPSGDALACWTHAGRLVALRREDGGILWTARPRSLGGGSLSERSGILYLPVGSSNANEPSALDAATGTVVWGSAPIDAGAGAPLPWRDLLLYACNDGFLRAVRAKDGSVAWTVTIGGSLLPPVLAGDMLIVASRTGYLAAVKLAP